VLGRLAFRSEKCQGKSGVWEEASVENFLREFGFFDGFKILMMEKAEKRNFAGWERSLAERNETAEDVGYTREPWILKIFWMVCASWS
jgi:hypothetical protein